MCINDYHMGITAENIAEQYGLTREEQDEFAAWSQQKAENALKKENSRMKLFQLKFHNVKVTDCI